MQTFRIGDRVSIVGLTGTATIVATRESDDSRYRVRMDHGTEFWAHNLDVRAETKQPTLQC
jgi:hypothetical protein